jgi:hypothetical protein
MSARMCIPAMGVFVDSEYRSVYSYMGGGLPAALCPKPDAGDISEPPIYFMLLYLQ